MEFESEIEILESVFGNNSTYEVIYENLEDVPNYISTLKFNEIRIIKLNNQDKNENNSEYIYVIYLFDLDIPYKIYNFEKDFFESIQNIYYQHTLNYSNQIKRFSGILSQIELTEEDLEKLVVKNKYLEVYYWGSFYDKYPFEDIYTKKFTRYQINKMNIYALKQYDDDIFEINVLTKYSKSKVTFRFYDNGFFIQASYNPINNLELKKFFKLTQYLPHDIPTDLYLCISKFHLLDYINVLELKPLTINHFKYSSFLIDNLNLNDIHNYFNYIDTIELSDDKLINYKNDLINLLTLNNIIKNINSKDILNILEEDTNYDDKKEKIKKYIIDYFDNYKDNNILYDKLKIIKENKNDFYKLHINNLISKFINN